MSNIPVYLERRFEQRWAARFSSPIASVTPKKYQQMGLARQTEKKKPRGGSAGLKYSESYRRPVGP
jgi:hypothetical protein